VIGVGRNPEWHSGFLPKWGVVVTYNNADVILLQFCLNIKDCDKEMGATLGEAVSELNSQWTHVHCRHSCL